MNVYHARAETRAVAARETLRVLEDLYARPRTDSLQAQIGAAHQAVRYGLKLAEVEALLSISSTLQQLAGKP